MLGAVHILEVLKHVDEFSASSKRTSQFALLQYHPNGHFGILDLKMNNNCRR
jgi:hypothetical protein